MAADQETQSGTGFLEFQADQQVLDIANIQVGGQPGVRPTVLIGSIFYHGQKIVRDEDRGEFDPEGAAELIRTQDDFSQRTGNPCMLDVVGATPEAIRKHLEFAAGCTESPLLIDGTTEDVRLAGLEYAAEAGLMDRVVYNSIQPEIGDDEFAAIKKAGVQNALILTYYMRDFTAEGRVACVKELLPRVHEAGVKQLMVDTCVLDLATFGQACHAMFDLKNQMGIPVGGGVHNAVAMWRGLKSKMGKQARISCVASASAAAAAVGADFSLYGPVEDAPYVFPAVAMVDTAHSQVAMERGDYPNDDHPRFRIG